VKKPLLETYRLNISPVSVEDAPFIFNLLTSPSWIKYIGDRGLKTIADAEKVIQERYLKHFETHGFGVYTITLKSDNTPIGLSTLLKKDYLDTIDIGYALLAEYEGNGYASEASKAVYEYAQTVLGYKRIVATTTLDNERSIHVLEKLGFSFEKNIENEGATLNVFANVPPQY
jgi:[ribosomal protein S5]-alanine N-acetyltransferase